MLLLLVVHSYRKKTSHEYKTLPLASVLISLFSLSQDHANNAVINKVTDEIVKIEMDLSLWS